MKTMKFLTVLLVSVLFMSCNFTASKDSDDLQREATASSLAEANTQIGMPAIQNFQERKLFKQIIELRDSENLITYCYLMNEMNGTIGQFLGKGIGYGIPAATQFTNPMATKSSYSGGFEILPQADPNGLFMPTQTSATWYMLLDEKGVPHPVYIEPLIIVSPIQLH